MKKLLYISIVVILAVGCKSTASTSTSGSGEAYKEDLTRLRPEFTLEDEKSVSDSNNVKVNKQEIDNVEPTNDVTAELNGVLDEIVSLRANINYVDGFTILVYTGTNSEQAHMAKGKVYSLLEGARPTLKFDEPNFRVKVGKYYNRIEAQHDYAALKKKFPSAILIPERIYIQ